MVGAGRRDDLAVAERDADETGCRAGPRGRPVSWLRWQIWQHRGSAHQLDRSAQAAPRSAPELDLVEASQQQLEPDEDARARERAWRR